jgi:nucleotide-binding universal stress UspA family protein
MYKKIMVPLDGSELAECVLAHVEGFIESCHVKAIIFIRAIKPEPMVSRGTYMAGEVDFKIIQENAKKIEEEKKSSAEGYLAQVTDRFSKYAEVTFQTKVIVGDVAECLIDYAEQNDIDLILIATHGRSGVSRWVRGSIADRILRASRIPVLMVRAPGTMGEKKSR